MVSLRKLAELAGVSHMAVWNALHNKPGVSPEARARILTLADEYHYHPNRLVEGLITGRTRTIGHITRNSTWHFLARVCSGIIHAAFHDQVHVMILNQPAQAVQTRAMLQTQASLLISQLIEQRVEGIIIFDGDLTVAKKSILEMWSHDIVPVLICNTASEQPLDRLETDERQLAQLAVDYLLRLGHQKIMYCGLESRCLRNQEMNRVFHMRGLALDYFIEQANMTAPDPQSAEEYLEMIFRKPNPPTAIICYDDHMAMQLLLCATHRGVRVPGDLSILGCGNHNFCHYLSPALTSIEQYPEEMGRRAYELIYRRHAEGGEPGARTPETIQIQPKLVIRESCGPPEARRSTPVPPSPGVLSSTPTRYTQTAHVATHVSAEMARLLSSCTGEQSQRELMAQLGLQHRQHFTSAYLQPALAAGYLERTIPDKPRSSRQQYRLTAKGRAAMPGKCEERRE